MNEIKQCRYMVKTPLRVCKKFSKEGGRLALCYLGITETKYNEYAPKEELKPCPFCGGKAIIVHQPKHLYPYHNAGVWCKKCKVHVWHRFDNSLNNETINSMLSDLWNRRAET